MPETNSFSWLSEIEDLKSSEILVNKKQKQNTAPWIHGSYQTISIFHMYIRGNNLFEG